MSSIKNNPSVNRPGQQPNKPTNPQGQQSNKQTNQPGQQKGNNPPQKPVDLKPLFNIFIIKSKLVNGIYIRKDDKDYQTISTDYKNPIIKTIEVFDKYYRPIGTCIVNSELPNFKSITKFNENEISQFFNSDTYDLDKNSNNWNIEIGITFNENLKKYNELKNIKELKISYLIKEIPGLYVNQKIISESHLNFKKHCETSYPPKEILNIYSSFVEDVNTFILEEKAKVDLNINYEFKNIVDNFHKTIEKITLNVESIPAPYTILQHLHNKNINTCDIKAINNIIQKIFSFTPDDTSKIKDLKFNYYNNIHFGVLVALLLYYKNYTGDVMKYKIYSDNPEEYSDKNPKFGSQRISKTGSHEKIYDPTFKMKTFNISTLIDLLKDSNDIIDEDEFTTEYYTPKYNKTFKSYITLLQYNAEIPKPNPDPKSYFKDENDENRKLDENFQITYKPETIKSDEFGFVMTLLAIDLDKHNKFYNSKTDFIKDIQFFMENGIKYESCSEYLLNNASQGLNSLINTSGNAISNISEKTGGLLPDLMPNINEYSKNFTKSMDIIANVLNDKPNIMTIVINNDNPVLDIEYKNERFKRNTLPLEDFHIENIQDMPICFQVTTIDDDKIIIDDNLNEYILKHIFTNTNAVISCNQDSTPVLQENNETISNNLFECMFYALNTKNVYENTQSQLDTNIKSDTIIRLRNIISKNIGNYELNEYLNNYETAKKNNEYDILNNSINTFIANNIKLYSVKNTQDNKYKEFDANKLLTNIDFYKLLDSLKIFVTTNDYWGDNYTVQIFEKYYNIKIILFDLDYDRIVCNTKLLINAVQVADQSQSTSKTKFDPTKMKYLFLSYYRNNNYNYIYNVIQFISSGITNEEQRKYIYTYNEIPKNIQESIIQDCSQNIDRPYSHYFTKNTLFQSKSTSNLKTKPSQKGGLMGDLPYGPFFNNLNYPLYESFDYFLFERIKKRNAGYSTQSQPQMTPPAQSQKQPQQPPAQVPPQPPAQVPPQPPAQASPQPQIHEQVSSKKKSKKEKLEANKIPENTIMDKIGKVILDQINNPENWILEKITRKEDGYEIRTNPAGGDCLFLAFLQSYNKDSDVQKPKSVEELRKFLSEKMNEATFATFKSSQGGDENYTFMKRINTLKDLKDFILTSSFWAETWAINEIEKEYNVKFIIFDKDYDYKVIKIIGNDKRDTTTTPLKYIMLDYSTDAQHYQLIQYKGQGQFSFNEIPAEIKNFIKNKYGDFTIDFKNYTITI